MHYDWTQVLAILIGKTSNPLYEGAASLAFEYIKALILITQGTAYPS